MPNIPCWPLGVGEDVAVERPHAQLGRLDDHLEPLPRRDVRACRNSTAGQEVAVLGDDQLRHAVQVHRVDHQPLVHVADQHLLALLADDRLGGREALAIEREAADRAVVEHHRVFHVERRPRRRILRLDDEGAEQPLGHLLGRVVVRVVHVRAGVAVARGEFVGEGLARA